MITRLKSVLNNFILLVTLYISYALGIISMQFLVV